MPPPGRPIVSGIGSLLEPLSRFCDFYLKPIVQNTPTYLKDTKSLLQLIQDFTFPENTVTLVTLDIESLYMSIPQDDTIKVLGSALNSIEWNYQASKEFILDCATLAHKENFFSYKGNLFLQCTGTSMGSTFAPSVAGLYVADFEAKHILQPNNPFSSSIYFWKRYIDDILLIWIGDNEQLQAFFTWVNTRDQNLKFTHASSKSEAIFLDVTIHIRGTRLTTKTYHKPTAKNNLLEYTSFHPRPLKENLPYGQYLRLRRNCSELTDFKTQSADLTSKLKMRGYPQPILGKSYKRARNQPREALLEDKIVTTRDIPLTCVMTHSTLSNFIKKSINKNWRILSSTNKTWEKPLFSFKKGRSLKDALVHTRPKQQTTVTPRSATEVWGLPKVVGHYPCSNCSVCHLTVHSKTLALEPGKTWTQRDHTNCNTENVIYLITCPCKLRYVGMTSRKVKLRICEHRSNVRCRKPTTKMSRHFLELNHTPNDMRWTIIEHLDGGHNNNNRLFEKEQRWVHRLGTHQLGLNDDIPWNSVMQ
ncbi:uncharacterized protein LOC144762705 [Lissotriton helveticus]